MINHLNAGRRANAQSEMLLFDEIDIPADLKLAQEGKSIEEYMDEGIRDHWDFYITQNVDTYMRERYKTDEFEKADNPDKPAASITS